MLNYLFFLILGFLVGYFINKKFLGEIKKAIMPLSILVLLFFMGVGIGKDPDLSHKIANFGINAFIIALSSIVFSIVFVFLFVRVLRKIF